MASKPTKDSLTDIILVKYNQAPYERECIKSVVHNTPEPYHLTVYENYRRDGNLSVVWNELIEKSDAEFICLLNTDTVVPKGWIGPLLETFEQEDDAVAVGPVTNKCGISFQMKKKTDDYDARAVSTLSGFCLVFRKELWEKAGRFNEKFKLYGEDTEFLERAKQYGKLYCQHQSFVYHHGAASSNKAQMEGKDIQGLRKEARILCQKLSDSDNRK